MGSYLKNEFAQHLLKNVPRVAAKPLQLFPFRLKGKILERLLSQLLSQQEEDEELDFLVGRWVAINIEDMQLAFEVSYANQWLVRPISAAEVTFTAQSNELVLIAAGEEDPDTLFFQRKLQIEGDTELGLEVKNLLLAVEFDSMPAPARIGISKLAQLIQKLQSTAGAY